MKFCKDCRHFDSGIKNGIITYRKCQRLGMEPPDPVTADERQIILYPSDERAPLTFIDKLFGAKRCGPDAVFWEPK